MVIFMTGLSCQLKKLRVKRFGELVLENIIQPLELKNTVPNIGDTVAFSLTGYDRD